MPHSSGGGSHGGGSHGARSTYSRSYHSHALHRYVYYDDKHHKPNYIYSKYDINELRQQAEETKRRSVRYSILMAVGLLLLCLTTIHLTPRALDVNSYPHDIKIWDITDTIKESDELYTSMEKFRDSTGITPALLILHDSDWTTKGYRNLERMAYQAYLDNFSDEKHWLFVYSINDDDPVDFSWEGMQGNDTDPILTGYRTGEFNHALHNRFEDTDISVEEAFALTFNEYSVKIFEPYCDIYVLIFYLILAVFFASIGLYLKYGKFKSLPYDEAIELDMTKTRQEEEQYEVKCEYCDGIYVKNTSGRCPYCGALIPLDYVRFDD